MNETYTVTKIQDVVNWTYSLAQRGYTPISCTEDKTVFRNDSGNEENGNIITIITNIK